VTPDKYVTGQYNGYARESRIQGFSGRRAKASGRDIGGVEVQDSKRVPARLDQPGNSAAAMIVVAALVSRWRSAQQFRPIAMALVQRRTRLHQRLPRIIVRYLAERVRPAMT
jgi:hypothetical protein